MGYFKKAENPTGKWPGEHWQDEASTDCVFVPEKMRKEIEQAKLREVRDELGKFDAYDMTNGYAGGWLCRDDLLSMFNAGGRFEVKEGGG